MSNKSKKEAFFKTFLFLIFLVLVLLLIDVDKISNIFENSNDGTSQTAEFRGLIRPNRINLPSTRSQWRKMNEKKGE